MTFEYNWHLLVFGLIYIIFLLGIQSVMLSLVDTSRKQSEADKMRAEIRRYEESKQKLKRERRKLKKQIEINRRGRNKAERDVLELKLKEAQKDEEKVNELIENIKENVTKAENVAKNKNNVKNEPDNNSLKKTRELLNNISISNLSSFAKKQGISV